MNQSVPKSLTRQKEEFHGLPYRFVLVLAAFIIIIFVLGSSILLSPASRGISIGILIIVLAIIYKCFRSPKIMDRSILIFKFLIRSLKGETIIAKFKLPDGFLETIIPIRKFHPEGIIEFMGNQYGLLMRIDPGRIADDDIDSHIQKTRSLLDSLHGELMTKAFVCSMKESSSKPLARNVVDIINTQERTTEQKKHLISIYNQTQDNKNTVIQWQFYLFLYIGTHVNIEKAMIARKQYFPGYLDKLRKLGVHVIPLITQDALASAYRKCILQGN